MEGFEIRFKKLFPNEKERPIIIPVDQGQYFGPIPGVEDLPALVSSLSQADALIIAPGALPQCKSVFCKRGGPLQMVRTNYVSGYCFSWEYSQPVTRKIFDPEFALKLGAEWVLASLCIGTGDEEMDLHNIEIFTEIVQKKSEWGIPLMGEFYPLNAEKKTEAQLHKITYEGCRIMYEMGADAVKTNFTGPKFNEIVESVPVPVIALGGPRMKTDLDSLIQIRRAIELGACGVCVGRNLVQSGDPKKYLSALIAIVKEGVLPEEAVRKFLE